MLEPGLSDIASDIVSSSQYVTILTVVTMVTMV